MLLEHRGKRPRIHESAYVAPTDEQIAVTGIGIFRFSGEGKVVES